MYSDFIAYFFQSTFVLAQYIYLVSKEKNAWR